VQGSVSGEALARQFIAQDYNKDGCLNIEGFKAVVLLPEFIFRVDEAVEAFTLVSRSGQFSYREFLAENNSFLRPLLFGTFNRAPSQITVKSDSNPGKSHSLISNVENQLTTGRGNQSILQPAISLPHDISLNESHISSIGAFPHNKSTSFIVEDSNLSKRFSF
jgi:hypothetical protein